MRVDLRHISDEKKLSYSDVLWQYVKQDFLWRINNAGLGKVLWLQKPYFVTGEKLAFYYVYGQPRWQGRGIMVRRLMYCAISL